MSTDTRAKWLRPTDIILGFKTFPPHTRIAFVNLDDFETVVNQLALIGVPYNPQQEWSGDHWTSLQSACKAADRPRQIHDSADAKSLAGELALGEIEFVELQGYEDHEIVELLRDNAPLYSHSLGVALIDISGFSNQAMISQLKALRLLDHLLSISLDEIRKELDCPLVSIAFASTGDGYYLFPINPSPLSNRICFHLLVRTLALAKLDGLIVKGSYTVDECFTFKRGLLNPIDGSSGALSINLLGNASNSLARIMDKARPNQFFVTHSAITYFRAGLEKEVDKVKHHYARPSFGDTDVKGIFSRSVRPLRKVLNECSGLRLVRSEEVPGDTFSPAEPILINGKHQSEIYYVWNVRVGVHFEGKQIFLGVMGDSIRPLESVRFLPEEVLDSL